MRTSGAEDVTHLQAHMGHCDHLSLCLGTAYFLQAPAAALSDADSDVTISDLDMQGRAASLSTAETKPAGMTAAEGTSRQEADEVIVIDDSPADECLAHQPFDRQAMQGKDILPCLDTTKSDRKETGQMLGLIEKLSHEATIDLVSPDQSGSGNSDGEEENDCVSVGEPDVAAADDVQQETLPQKAVGGVQGVVRSPSSKYGTPLSSPLEGVRLPAMPERGLENSGGGKAEEPLDGSTEQDFAAREDGWRVVSSQEALLRRQGFADSLAVETEDPDPAGSAAYQDSMPEFSDGCCYAGNSVHFGA